MKSKKVLIVEDNRDGADTLRSLVDAWGHHAQVAYDGRAGVELAHTFRPNIAIMDINMPLMDGYATARQLKIDDDRTLLIAMTGVPAVETRRRAREAGFHHYYAKPVALDELRALLDSETPDM